MEVSFYTDELFTPQIEVLMEAYDEAGNVIGKPSAGAAVNPATQTVTLEKGTQIQIVLRMDSDFEGKFTVKALNPTTLTTYGTLNLQTDYTI